MTQALSAMDKRMTENERRTEKLTRATTAILDRMNESMEQEAAVAEAAGQGDYQ